MVGFSGGDATYPHEAFVALGGGNMKSGLSMYIRPVDEVGVTVVISSCHSESYILNVEFSALRIRDWRIPDSGKEYEDGVVLGILSR